MKDIYSPLEIDEEWDNYAPAADGSSTALMERPAGVSTDGPTEGNGPDTEAATTTTVPVTPDVMPDSRVMPGIDSNNSGTQESSQPDIAYTAAEALIDKPTTNTDTLNIADTSSSNSLDTSGLVKITPDETTPEIPSTDTPHKIEPVKIDVMGGEAADSGVKLPEVVDQSNGGTSSPDVPVISPFIAPVEPGEKPKEETDEQTDEGDSDVVFDTGTITPDTGEKSTDTIKASDDDGGESSDDNVENRESATADDTDDTESDTAGSSSETKADKPKAPTSAGDDELATIMDKWNSSNKEIAEMLEQAKKDSAANIARMQAEKSNIQSDLSQQISELDEGINNERARLSKIQANLAKLPSDEAN